MGVFLMRFLIQWPQTERLRWQCIGTARRCPCSRGVCSKFVCSFAYFSLLAWNVEKRVHNRGQHYNQYKLVFARQNRWKCVTLNQQFCNPHITPEAWQAAAAASNNNNSTVWRCLAFGDTKHPQYRLSCRVSKFNWMEPGAQTIAHSIRIIITHRQWHSSSARTASADYQQTTHNLSAHGIYMKLITPHICGEAWCSRRSPESLHATFKPFPFHNYSLQTRSPVFFLIYFTPFILFTCFWLLLLLLKFTFIETKDEKIVKADKATLAKNVCFFFL